MAEARADISNSGAPAPRSGPSDRSSPRSAPPRSLYVRRGTRALDVVGVPIAIAVVARLMAVVAQIVQVAQGSGAIFRCVEAR